MPDLIASFISLWLILFISYWKFNYEFSSLPPNAFNLDCPAKIFFYPIFCGRESDSRALLRTLGSKKRIKYFIANFFRNPARPIFDGNNRHLAKLFQLHVYFLSLFFAGFISIKGIEDDIGNHVIEPYRVSVS